MTFNMSDRKKEYIKAGYTKKDAKFLAKRDYKEAVRQYELEKDKANARVFGGILIIIGFALAQTGPAGWMVSVFGAITMFANRKGASQ
jgi:hypothetical protein